MRPTTFLWLLLIPASAWLLELDGSSRRSEGPLCGGTSVIFVHIPKCGGNSVHDMMMRSAGHCKASTQKNRICYRAACHECGCKAWEGPLLGYVTGHTHFGFGLGDRLRTERPVFVTMIRDPRSWLVSLVWFKYELNDGLIKRYFKEANTVADDLKLSYLLEKTPSFSRHLESWINSEGVLPFLAGTNVQGPREAELRCAAWNLLDVDIIGDLNDVPGFMAQLRFHLGPLVGKDLPRRNSKKRNVDILNPSARAVFDNITRDHRRFYDLASSVVHARTLIALNHNPENLLTVSGPDYDDFFSKPPPEWCESYIIHRGETKR